PIHLVLQDVVLVGGVVLFAWLSGDPGALHVLPLFLGVYLLLLGGSFFFTGAWPCGYLVGFGLGLIVWLWNNPLASTGTALATYAVAYQGLRWSLAHFPWKPMWSHNLGQLVVTNTSNEE